MELSTVEILKEVLPFRYLVTVALDTHFPVEVFLTPTFTQYRPVLQVTFPFMEKELPWVMEVG